MKWITVPAFLLSLLTMTTLAPAQKWTDAQADAWYARQPWLVGCNFIPSTAINQLEMWQADTFDLPTIDRELGLAESLGFTTVRVFLHDLLWDQDKDGLLKRMDQFLDVAHKHHIGVMFVFFDGCWHPHPKLGQQPDPKPHTHNSGWVQSPSQDLLKDPSKHDSLKTYVQGVLTRFKNDPRITAWDVYNEPDNPNTSAYGKMIIPDKADRALELLTKTFQWAQEVRPSQPLTAGPWHGDWSSLEKMPPVGRLCLEQSDVPSYHNYGKLDDMKHRVAALRKLTNRPLLCTEYMARPAGSTFADILPWLKEQRIAAYNWGFVSGKSQTIYPWDSWTKHYTAQPPVWFHDIFHPDGTPYRPEEVALIKKLTKRE